MDGSWDSRHDWDLVVPAEASWRMSRRCFRCSPMIGDANRRIRAVAERISSGDHAGAAEQFVETVALGSGMWTQVSLKLVYRERADLPRRGE